MIRDVAGEMLIGPAALSVQSIEKRVVLKHLCPQEVNVPKGPVTHLQNVKDDPQGVKASLVLRNGSRWYHRVHPSAHDYDDGQHLRSKCPEMFGRLFDEPVSSVRECEEASNCMQ